MVFGLRIEVVGFSICYRPDLMHVLPVLEAADEARAVLAAPQPLSHRSG